MNTKKLLVLASLLCFALIGCEPDPTLIVTTGDATTSYHRTSTNGVTITTERVNFHATFVWEGDTDQPLPKALGGVFYGKTYNLSADNNLGSTRLIEIRDDTFNIFSETYEFDLVYVNVNTKDDSIADLFAPGDTMYYRAYAKVINGINDTSYIFGEEKSVVMPK